MACKVFHLSNVCINSSTLKVFSFADINITYQFIALFFISFVQVAASVIKTSAIFNSNPKSNVGSFSYIAKKSNQTLSVDENKASDNKVTSIAIWLSGYKAEDNHIGQEVNKSGGLQNNTTNIMTMLYMLSYLRS